MMAVITTDERKFTSEHENVILGTTEKNKFTWFTMQI